MRLAEAILRLLLSSRDRDTISGDLLEEYREQILPSRGRWAARAWYIRQVLSFVSPAMWGLALGTAIGSWALIDTAVEPLADDTAGKMAALVIGMTLAWAVISLITGRRTGRFRDAVTAGVLVGVTTIAMFHIAAIIRVNVFLDQIRFRDDWQGLLTRFNASGATSLRQFANVTYLTETPVALAIGAAVGAVSGAIGGLFGTAWRRLPTR
jgi:hypothetical protein